MDWLLELLVCLQSVWLAVICPYTKVEESFNLQAVHDVLYHGANLTSYDHHEFPGVVPRTFIGPIVISAVTYPIITLSCINKLTAQYIVRVILGLIVTSTFLSYTRAIRTTLGPLVSRFLCVVTIVQFHFLFYSSRPLPNTFALAMVLVALRFCLLKQYPLFIWMAGASIILFRFELCLFFGLILIQELVFGQLTVKTFLCHTIPAGIIWLSLTVFIDSYFWQKWVWPEGEVLWFNTVMNKSSQWGTSPMWWYFSSALPRSLLLPLLLIPWGVYSDQRSLSLLLPALGFVCVYSLLPHKELRFIIYTVPVFNTIAAMGCAQTWRNRHKYSFLIPFGLVCSLLLSSCLSLVFLSTSISNYPGGHAFRGLHRIIEDRGDNIQSAYSVHIGVEAAMTGVSRFGETQSTWNYLKLEGLQAGSKEMIEFDFLLISAADFYHYNSTHSVLIKEAGFSRLSLNPREFPPLTVIVEDKIYVLEKNKPKS